MKIVYLLISILALFYGIFFVLGYSTPEGYIGSVEVEVDSGINFVWQELINVSSIEKRKRDVKSVQIIDTSGQLIAWQENLKNGGYRIYKMTDFYPNQKLGIELVESSYGLTGNWTFELYDQKNTTRVIIYERSILENIQMRGIRALFGRDYDLLVWLKYIKVGVIQTLLITP